MKNIISNSIILISFLVILITACGRNNQVPVIEIKIPPIENFVFDGNSDDWGNIESTRLWANPLGGYAEPSDLEASLKVSWSENYMLFLLEVSDQSLVSDTINPWSGDAIEVFISPFRGSAEILQFAVIPSMGGDYIRIIKSGGDSISALLDGIFESLTKINGNKRTTEIKIGLRNYGSELKPLPGLAFQVYVDDADEGGSGKNQYVYYPTGQSYSSSSSMFNAHFSHSNQMGLIGASRVVITDNEIIKVYVFGATDGDKIGLYKNGLFLENLTSNSAAAFQPDTIDISGYGFDIERDSFFVTINGESLSLHELFLSPRIYEKLQEKRFERDIRNYVFMDRISPPPKNATLFIGSSSIVRWETLKRDFPDMQIIKRGFGGSTSPEALMYINEIVFPYKPSIIVYYEGDNDIVMGLSPEEVRENVRAFVEQVKERLPETQIYILSPKPSINRMHLWEKYKTTHYLLHELSKEYDKVYFVDVSTPMFDKSGKLRNSLFVEDGIHMNQDGYSIWTSVLKLAFVSNK